MKYMQQLSAIIDSTVLPRNDGTDIYQILTIALTIFGAIAVIVVIWAGIQMILSQGNSEKVAQARRGIIYAVAGLIVIFFAQVLVQFIKTWLTK